MSSKNKPDFISILIGTLILCFIIWKVVAYLLPDRTAYTDGKELLKDVMIAHGGLENWNNKETLYFKKQFKLYTEDDCVDIDRKETHEYKYAPKNIHKIQWRQEQDHLELKKIKDSIYQLKNKQLDTLTTQSQLFKKLNAAQIVINIPYSLNDVNAKLDYKGVQDFQETACYVLQVSFKDSWDSWWLYFKEEDLSWLGYWVQTDDHYSLVINEEMVDINGFTLSRKRRSYRTDQSQNILYLRAEYLYDDYEIN